MTERKKARYLLGLARGSVRYSLQGKDPGILKEGIYTEKRGVFVTLKDSLSESLRGCIGYPYPALPLEDALIKASLSAAFDDPRFPSVRMDELESIRFELSLLTYPERIDVDGSSVIEDLVVAGKHGLIVEKGSRSGLLLPQVASEQGWDARTLIEQACVKAGLDEDAYIDDGSKIYRFCCERFYEGSSDIKTG